jgi:hypothetical protein
MSDDLIKLNDKSTRLEGKNDYFLVTITDLQPSSTYPLEFRWNYLDKSKKGAWSAIKSITTPSQSINGVSGVTPAWSNTDFNITFTSDPSAAGNENLSYYKITLTSGSDSKNFNLTPVPGSTQKFSLSLSQNRASFGVLKTAFSGSIVAVDIYENSSAPTTFSLTSYTNALTAPSLTLTAISNGYNVSYTTPSEQIYDHIEIEEVESSSGTDPGTGYGVIFSGVANPAVIIVPNTNKRWVRAKFYDDLGSSSSYGTAVSVTPISPVVIDNTPPAAPSTGTVSAGIESGAGATIGFNAYLDVSWNAVSDSTLRGYRLRFRRNGSSDPYGYVDSPGTGTSFRISGLSTGTTYEVGVASYDEFNNTSSSYTALGTAASSGTPFIGTNVTTTGYFGASSSGETGLFKFGYGVESGKRGLSFNTNNYWYIDSNASALFKLGGDTNNFISWDGATFIVQGDIRAKAGNFSGNVQITSGGSLYSGLLSGNSLSGAGFILNTSGLTFNSSSVNGITTIDAATGLLTTSSANIGGWGVTSSAIAKTSSSGTLTLNSSNAQITVASSSYQAGIATPNTNSSSDIVFWAGGSRGTSANFYVTADGTVKASGSITAQSLTTTALSIASTGAITTTSGKFGVNVLGEISATGGIVGGWSLSSTSISKTVGTKTLTLDSSNAIITIDDTSTGILSGGGINMTSGSVTGSYGAGGIAFASTGSAAILYSATDLLISGGATTGITLRPGAGLGLQVQVDGVLNSLTGSISSGNHTGTPTTQTAGAIITASGAVIARRDNSIPFFAHKFNASGTTEMLRFIYNGNDAGGVQTTASGVPSLRSASDYRLKNGITDFVGAADIIKTVRLRSYRYNIEPDKDAVGFVAHELASVLPSLVFGEKDAIDEKGNPIYQSVATTDLIPYLTGALKEALLSIESLKSRLDALEG